MTINNNNNNNNLQPKTSEAQKRANAKYNKKTYRNRTVYIKLTDLEKIDAYLQKVGMSCTQFFYKALRDNGVDVWL